MLNAATPLEEWLRWLESLSPHEIDLGLDRVREVLDRLDLEQPPLVLLIGGTNGKGTSVAMTEALLLAAGYRVGAYTSPHLVRYNERIRIDGIEAGDQEIAAALAEVEAARGDLPLTYFEFGTLAALVQFARESVDAWVLEVGLGGRLDATNAVEPTASLITNVTLDHMDWLGDDVETIAAEKAGIMRAARPVVFGSNDVPDAIRDHAAEVGAHLVLPEIPADATLRYRNAGNVRALLDAVGVMIEDDLAAGALAGLNIAGRCQRHEEDGIEWLLDVGHNPAAAQAFAGQLEQTPTAGATTAIIGMLDDKDAEGVVEALAGQVSQWIAVTPASHRAVQARELARRIANLTGSFCLVAEDFEHAREFARRHAAENDRILVTGSFFTVGPFLELFGLAGTRPE